MGCTPFLEEVDPVTGKVNVTRVLLNLQRQDQREFLGFGVFETTAVLVAFFVAGYVLVGDPTGTQHAHDLSEYTVYAQWRWAMLFLLGDLAFTGAVLVHELVHCWRGSDVTWLVLLMFAPWAPVARQVRQTLGAWRRVRTMMRARMVSNTLAAVLREGFYLGYPGISTLAVGEYVFKLNFEHPEARNVPKDLGADTTDMDLRGKVKKALASSNALPLTKSSLRHGPQLADFVGWRLWVFRHLPCLDPFAWWWSMHPLVPIKDPFQYIWPEQQASWLTRRLMAQHDKEGVTEELAEEGLVTLPPPLPFNRVRILDVIDLLQPGGTVAEPRLLSLRSHAVCERCIMAVRAAVETFLESSSRQHAGARVARWFQGVHVKWYGGVAACLDIMWEACFVDNNSGMRVDGDLRGDKEPGTGRGPTQQRVSGTEMTSWFLLLLFLVTRSLLRHASSLSKVDQIVRDRLQPSSFWPLFWESMRAKVKRTYPHMGATAKVQSDRAVEQLMDEALVDTIDKHVCGDVVGELCSTFIDTTDYLSGREYLGLARLCDVDTCILHQPNSILTFTRKARPQKRRPATPKPVVPVETQPSA